MIVDAYFRPRYVEAVIVCETVDDGFNKVYKVIVATTSGNKYVIHKGCDKSEAIKAAENAAREVEL